jgi:hypothetical protein
MWFGQLSYATGGGMMSKPKLDAEKPVETRPDWWFTVVSTAGAFAVIATSVASWLPISDALLLHVQIPVSLLSGIVGGVLGYFVTHRHPRD